MIDEMAIGALARRTGVKVPTIRYYESIGLLPSPLRSESGRRVYGEVAVRRLSFIRHARELGFEIDAIRDLLALQVRPGGPCSSVDAIARHHLIAVDGKIARLKRLRKELTRMLADCQQRDIASCKVIEALADHPSGASATKQPTR